jgi:hypothetical protein
MPLGSARRQVDGSRGGALVADPAWTVLTVDYRIKVHMDLQADKSPRRSQGTLLPSSGEPKVSNPWNNVQRKDSI